MMPFAERKQIFINMLERDVGELYYRCEDLALSALQGIPTAHLVAKNYIGANRKQWFAILENKIAEIADLSFLSADATLDEALSNADKYLNLAIGEFLSKNLGIPMGAVNIAAQIAFGRSLAP